MAIDTAAAVRDATWLHRNGDMITEALARFAERLDDGATHLKNVAEQGGTGMLPAATAAELGRDMDARAEKASRTVRELGAILSGTDEPDEQ